MKTKAFYLFALAVLSLGFWLSAGFLSRSLGPDWLGALPIVAWLVVSALALAATKVSRSVWIYAGLLILAVSSFPHPLLVNFFLNRLSLPFGLTLLFPSTAVLVTLLLYSGLDSDRVWRHVSAADGESSQAQRTQAVRAAIVPVLSALALVCWQFAQSVIGFISFPFDALSWLIVVALVLLLVSALVTAARKVNENVWIYVGLVVLAGLFLPSSTIVRILPSGWSLPFSGPTTIVLFSALSAAPVMAALLLYSGLTRYQAWRNATAIEGDVSRAQRKQAGKTAVVVLALGALLLAKVLHSLYWLMVWDTTYDSLELYWLLFPVTAVLLSGIVLSIALPGRIKLAGFLYSLLIPALMIAVSLRAQSVDFRRLTETRAERANRAIETYYARKGRFPSSLRQLPPWYALSLPGPVIIYGQDWCYDGGEDYYRLGYVYREHWSDPELHGRIYKSQGQAPEPDICAQEIAALEARYPFFRERK